MIASLEPAVLVEALAVEDYEAQHRPVVLLVDLLGDVAEVEREDLVAGERVLLLLCHLEDEVPQTLVLLKVFVVEKRVRLLLLLFVLLVFFRVFLILFISRFHILISFAFLIFRLSRRGRSGRSTRPEVTIVVQDLLCAEYVPPNLHHVRIRV